MKRRIASALLAALMTAAPAGALAENDVPVNPYEYVSTWAEEEVEKANGLGLIPQDWGITDYTAYITREKFCSLARQLTESRGCGTPSDAENPFDDTDSADVISLAAAGIIEGRGDGVFAPDDNITREEAAAILCRLAEYIGVDLPETGAVEYKDTDYISDWAADAVNIMRQMEVMNGVTTEKFAPDWLYSVEQSAATMVRLYDYAEKIVPVRGVRNRMNFVRYNPACAVAGGNIYVIGNGLDAKGGKGANTMDVCEGGTNIWRYAGKSDYILEGTSAVSDGETIYLVGGLNGDEMTDNVSAYNTKTRSWREVGHTGIPLEFAKIALLDNKIYITRNNYEAMDEMAVYDIETDETSYVDYPQDFDLLRPGPVSCGGAIYVFGMTDDENSAYVYRDGEWTRITAAPYDYDNYGALVSAQTDGDKIYALLISMIGGTLAEYDPERDSWRTVINGYMSNIDSCGFALCDGYGYMAGGVDEQVRDTDIVEAYYYKWTYEDYDPDNDFALVNSIGFDYEPNGKSYDVMPEILSAKVNVLDKENGLYELSVPEKYYVCDPNASPYFFWQSYTGCFDGNNPDFSRVIFHAEPGQDAKIIVGIGDGSGQTDKKSFIIPAE